MLRFTQYEKDIKSRAKEITFARGRLLLVAALASLVLTAYFLIVGLGWQESEALRMGWMSVVLCLVCFLLYLRMYFVVKKNNHNVVLQICYGRKNRFFDRAGKFHD